MDANNRRFAPSYSILLQNDENTKDILGNSLVAALNSCNATTPINVIRDHIRSVKDAKQKYSEASKDLASWYTNN